MATIQGYKLYYKEEGQQESGPILLRASDSTYTISGLGEQDLMILSAQGEIREQKGWPEKVNRSPYEVAQTWPNLFMGSLEEAVRGAVFAADARILLVLERIRGNRMLTGLCLS